MDQTQYTVILILICVMLFVSIIASIFATLSFYNARKAKKSLNTTSLKLTADVTYDSDNFGETLQITVYNSNYRDVVLHDFGFKYKNQIVSFIEEYSERKLTKGRVVVPSRSSITYKVNPERIERFVVSHNFNAKSIDSIYITAVDAVGTKAIFKDKDLTKVFAARQKARLKLAKMKIHEEKVDKYKIEHDGNAPLSDSVWRSFHKKQIKVPEICKKANSFINDKTVTPQQSTFNYSNARPVSNKVTNNVEKSDVNEVETNPQPSQEKIETKDLKVTFLDLDMPLKATENKKK